MSICPKCKKDTVFCYKEDVIEEGTVENDGSGGLDFNALERDSDGSTLEITCSECGESIEFEELQEIFKKEVV